MRHDVAKNNVTEPVTTTAEPERRAETVLIQMTCNYASAQTILREGQVYNVTQDVADALLACDPPACKVKLDPGVRQSRVTAPDPEQ